MDGVALTVRFLENEYYDIENDMDVVKLMAITGQGTWCGTTPTGPGLRERRKEFKEYVIDQMYKGGEPCEVEFD